MVSSILFVIYPIEKGQFIAARIRSKPNTLKPLISLVKWPFSVKNSQFENMVQLRMRASERETAWCITEKHTRGVGGSRPVLTTNIALF